jgi:GxxExxY protein
MEGKILYKEESYQIQGACYWVRYLCSRIIVNGIILVELKRKPFLTKQDGQQFWYYLKATPYKLGYLINFGDKGLEIKRRIYDKARQAQRGLASDSQKDSHKIRLE